MRAHIIRLAIILAAIHVLSLWPMPACPEDPQEANTPSFIVTGGYSGYAVPLPDYSARVVAQGDEQYSTTNLVYNDMSLAPLHIRLCDDYADSAVEVIVHSRSCPVSPPASVAFLAQSTTELPGYVSDSDSRETLPYVNCRLEMAFPQGTGSDIYLPVQIYQVPRDASSAVLQVEVLRNGQSAGKEAVELSFLPRGKVYSCLIEAEGRGLLEGDSLDLADESLEDAWLKYPGFRQEHALVSVAPEDIGPDFRVLRHFGFVILSAGTWAGLDGRARTLLTDAAALGARLVVYGAATRVTVGGEDHQPQRGLQLTSFGFGSVAVSPDDLILLREHMAELLHTDLRFAYSLALGRLESAGEASGRDLVVRSVLGNLNAAGYSWIGRLSTLAQTEGAINPAWAYSYITRAGLLHPLDAARLHWDSRELEQANSELVERSKVDYPPLHSKLSTATGRTSRPYGFETALYTVLLLVLSTFWFVGKRSYLWLVLAFLILSLLATVLFSFSVGIGVPDRPSALVLSASLVSPKASVVEARNVAYISSAHASRHNIGIPSGGFALGRIAPLDASEVDVFVSANGNAEIGNLRIAPMLPLEVSFSEVRAGAAPVSFAWEALSESERGLSLVTSKALSFTFLVDGPRAIYLGEIQPGQPRSIILPQENMRASSGQIRYDAIIAGLAHQMYSPEFQEIARGEELLDLARLYLSEVLLHEAIRTLIVEGRGTTIVGIHLDEYPLSLSNNVYKVPRAELLIYRLARE